MCSQRLPACDNRLVGHMQRLSKDRPIDGIVVKKAKKARANACRVQDRLSRVEPGTRVISAIGKNVGSQSAGIKSGSGKEDYRYIFEEFHGGWQGPGDPLERLVKWAHQSEAHRHLQAVVKPLNSSKIIEFVEFGSFDALRETKSFRQLFERQAGQGVPSADERADRSR